MENYVEPVFGSLDFGFDYGRQNVSLSAAPITGLLAGKSFQITAARGQSLPDAMTVALSIDGGTVTGQPTVVIEGTLDGTNWGAILPAINSNFATSTTLLIALSAHSGNGVPTHILGIRVRISIVGTGTGKLTATITS